MSLSAPTLLALALAASYLLGAVPFAWVLVRVGTGQDLRRVGSGNIGATNAMRAAGRPVGMLAFLLDAAKGLVPVVWLGPWAAAAAAPPAITSDWAAVLAGSAAVVGHCFPVYLGFRGGKGVATGCGALLGLDWRLFAIGGAVWLAALLITRYVGLASILMGVTFPVAAGFLFGPSHPAVFGAAALLLLILIRHRSNMARMLAGTEPKAFQSRGARTNGGSA
jgi:glycerol-3-phosphate acyltransferase PlsY